MRRALVLACLAAMVCVARAGASPPPGAGACPVFPADNVWHADVSSLPVHARSEAWITSMGGPDRRLHPDFGPSGEALPYGIPYKVVDGAHEKVAFSFEYADESDPGPYPFGPDVPVEGGSDRHALMIDRDACRLYELFAVGDDGRSAGSGAVFDLRSNALRPAGWTSADAAGLPIFPGLLRRDEVASGEVDHAIRITASRTSRAYLWPARHYASSSTDPNLPPMGAWFRMKASFDISGYSPTTQVVLRAFKKHGAIVADNGSNWYFTGAADEGWEDGLLDELKSIPAGAFEAVDASGLMVSPDSGQVRGASASAGAVPPAAPAAPVATTVRPAPATTAPAPRPPVATPAAPTTTATTPTTTSTVVEVVEEVAIAASARHQPRVPRLDRARPARTRDGGGGFPWWVLAPALMPVVTSARDRRRRRRP